MCVTSCWYTVKTGAWLILTLACSHRSGTLLGIVEESENRATPCAIGLLQGTAPGSHVAGLWPGEVAGLWPGELGIATCLQVALASPLHALGLKGLVCICLQRPRPRAPLPSRQHEVLILLSFCRA